MIEQTLSIIKPDAVVRKLENEIKNYTNKVNKFVGSEDEEVTISTKDQRRIKSYNSFLNAYDQISKGMEKRLPCNQPPCPVLREAQNGLPGSIW